MVRLMMVSVAFLICLSAVSGAYLASPDGEPAGKKAGYGYVLDLDAEEGKVKGQLLQFQVPLLRLFLSAPLLTPLPMRSFTRVGSTDRWLYLLFHQLKVPLR